jgi:hypothetical protein
VIRRLLLMAFAALLGTGLAAVANLAADGRPIFGPGRFRRPSFKIAPSVSPSGGSLRRLVDRIGTLAQRAARAEERVLIAGVPTWAIFVVSLALGGWALHAYIRADLSLIHGDAIGHLNIARRTIDSVTPSFAQLGGIWLPLPHLLMLPTIWNDTMWHTGLSGSIISVLAFAFSTAYIYRIVLALTGRGLGAVVCAALFATNPNMLFMQATPMTESLTVFLILASTFHVLRWVQTGSLFHLLVSAAFLMAATMTRYEAWALVPVGAVLVAVTSFLKHGTFRHAEGLTIAWGTLAGYGIVLWLLYNQIIFGDFLSFSRGQGSASAFARSAEAADLLPTKHDFLLSASAYGWAVVDNLGLPLVLAGIAGFLVLVLSRQPLPVKLAVLLPAAIFAFHATSLMAGQSVLWTPHTSPRGFLNLRYGLLLLPAAVIAAGWLARPLRSAGVLPLGAILLPQLLTLPGPTQAASVVESQVKGYTSSEIAEQWISSNFPVLRGDQQVTLTEEALAATRSHHEIGDAAKWLRRHAKTGAILISAQVGSSEGLMFQSGFSLSRFITEGNKPFFPEDLESPGRHAKWIVVQPDEPFDALKPLADNGGPAGFKLVFENEQYQIWAKADGQGQPGVTTRD